MFCHVAPYLSSITYIWIPLHLAGKSPVRLVFRVPICPEIPPILSCLSIGFSIWNKRVHLFTLRSPKKNVPFTCCSFQPEPIRRMWGWGPQRTLIVIRIMSCCLRMTLRIFGQCSSPGISTCKCVGPVSMGKFRVWLSPSWNSLWDLPS